MSRHNSEAVVVGLSNRVTAELIPFLDLAMSSAIPCRHSADWALVVHRCRREIGQVRAQEDQLKRRQDIMMVGLKTDDL